MRIGLIFVACWGIALAGCSNFLTSDGKIKTVSISMIEPEWIRNGEPIEYEGEKWYPQDGIEVMTDAEVYALGEYRGVPFFIDKQDVRPYDRLYTKFGHNKFRYFEKIHR